jgi:hypothetical protein
VRCAATGWTGMVPAASSASLIACGAAIALLLGGCGEAIEDKAREQVRPNGAPRSEPTAAERTPAAPAPEPARCPAGLSGCRTAEGTIIFVEKVDPDGDGDAHVVLRSEEGITAPGLSVIDVRRDLRPEPLPEPGDRISAAGPVYPGSYGQRQIEAVVVNTAYTPPQ